LKVSAKLDERVLGNDDIRIARLCEPHKMQIVRVVATTDLGDIQEPGGVDLDSGCLCNCANQSVRGRLSVVYATSGKHKPLHTSMTFAYDHKLIVADNNRLHTHSHAQSSRSAGLERLRATATGARAVARAPRPSRSDRDMRAHDHGVVDG
jgi:hypothetical protein